MTSGWGMQRVVEGEASVRKKFQAITMNAKQFGRSVSANIYMSRRGKRDDKIWTNIGDIQLFAMGGAAGGSEINFVMKFEGVRVNTGVMRFLGPSKSLIIVGRHHSVCSTHAGENGISGFGRRGFVNKGKGTSWVM